MQFNVNFTFTLKSSLDPFEEFLKSYYYTHLDSHLEKPFSPPLPKELIEAISKYINNAPSFSRNFNYFSDALLNLLHKETIVAASHSRYLPAGIHSHSFFEIIYVLSGTCVNYSGNQAFELCPGDLVILAPNTSHALSVFADDCKVINILMRASIFEETFREIFVKPSILHDFFTFALYGDKTNMLLLSHTKNDPIIQLAVLSLLEYRFYVGHSQEQMKISYMDVLFNRILTKHKKDTAILSEQQIDTKQDHNIALILQYMNQHYQTVTLSELSTFFGYSERHMTRILKEHTCNGFQKNILHIRMQHVLKLLEDKDYSLEDIATLIGYTSMRNFRNSFKQQFGLSPSEFRKRIGLQ